MIRKITNRLGARNLLVLALVGSLAVGGASAVLADDRDDQAVNRREDLVVADVEARDDDDRDDATGDGDATNGDDGTNGGNNTGDGDATNGDDSGDGGSGDSGG